MKLSIITINYNNAQGLEETIQSILPCLSSDIEYIIVDGKSTDDSIEIIKKHESKVASWISEPDKGVYNAMNKGLKTSKGGYILFLNSGDVINKDIDFKSIIANLNGEDLVYFNQQITNIDNNTSFTKTYPKHLDFKYFAEDSLPHMGSFIKREQLVKYGRYNEDFKIVSDWAFFMDLICIDKCSYKHVDQCFSTFFSGGISSVPDSCTKIQSEQLQHIENNYPLFVSLYKEWLANKQELYKLKTSQSVKMLKRVGCLKWLKD